MEGWVLVVEPNRPVRHAVVSVLEARGYYVAAAANSSEVGRQLRSFDCGVFSDHLPDGSAISLAGWLLVQRRIRHAVFFGSSKDVDLRLRASNLGTFVGSEQGLHHLERAIAESLSEGVALAVGDVASGYLASAPRSGLRRRP